MLSNIHLTYNVKACNNTVCDAVVQDCNSTLPEKSNTVYDSLSVNSWTRRCCVCGAHFCLKNEIDTQQKLQRWRETTAAKKECVYVCMSSAIGTTVMSRLFI